ncbi:MAG: glycosyl hydrolase family 28 protein [Phaeodactylibacter sp.]|uniref:glycoside hydrolase family 28 protein n=1 Tax=Phaeodactylibacter sp. TaxID=1940289 RepID=UPI0032EEB0FA
MRSLIVLSSFAFLLSSCSNPGNQAASSTDRPLDGKVEEILGRIHEPVIPGNTIDLAEFSGHSPDQGGSHDFYEDIRRAIDTLSARGGGRLVFSHTEGPDFWIRPTETYRIRGPIQLKSNIELRLHTNIRLFFEFDPPRYLPDGQPVLRRYEGTTLYSFSPLINAVNAENVAITSVGEHGALPVIDGDGEKWQKWSYGGDLRVQESGRTPAYKAIRSEFNNADLPIAERIAMDTGYHFLRPDLMSFFHSRNILVEGLRLEQSPFWVVHPVFCDNMIMRDVIFDCQIINNDGIDIESSANVLVEHVIFDNYDDNVVIKSGRDREGREGALVAGTLLDDLNSPYVTEGRITAPTQNVVVRDCVFKGHYAFCVGSEASGGVRNIHVMDCWGPMEVAKGIFFKSGRSRGGLVEDVYIRNLRFNEVEKEAISIVPRYDNDTTSAYPPTFRNIQIQNVTVNQAGQGLLLFGWPDAPVLGVELEDVFIETVSGEGGNDKLWLNQVKGIKLERVNIEGEDFSGRYSQQDSASLPPRRG